MNTIIYLYVDTLVLITKDEIYYHVLLFLVKIIRLQRYVYKNNAVDSSLELYKNGVK